MFPGSQSWPVVEQGIRSRLSWLQTFTLWREGSICILRKGGKDFSSVYRKEIWHLVTSHYNGDEQVDLHRNPAVKLRLVWQPLWATVPSETEVSECHVLDTNVKYSDHLGGGVCGGRGYLALTHLDKYPTRPSSFLWSPLTKSSSNG